MKLILLILLLPALLTAQRHAFPYYITLTGNDKIQQTRIEINITENKATITTKQRVLTYRIIKRDTSQIEHVLTLSCGGRLRLEYIKSQLYSFSFSCPGITLFSSIGFCEAVERGEYLTD